MNHKAVIFDIDGTIAWSKQAVTPEMGSRLAKLMSKVPVGIMSGAGYMQYQKQMLPALPLDSNLQNLYLFPTSASQCWQYTENSWRPVYNLSFTTQERDLVISALKKGLHITGLDTLSPLWGEQIEDRGSQISFSALGQQAPLPEKMAWDPDRKKREPLAAYLKEQLLDFSVVVAATTTIDITRKGITKAYGVEQFANMLSCTPQDMLYIGDGLYEGGNDAVVIPTGIEVRAVKNPDETTLVIDELCT